MRLLKGSVKLTSSVGSAGVMASPEPSSQIFAESLNVLSKFAFK